MYLVGYSSTSADITLFKLGKKVVAECEQIIFFYFIHYHEN